MRLRKRPPGAAMALIAAIAVGAAACAAASVAATAWASSTAPATDPSASVRGGRAEPLPNDLQGIEIRDHPGGSIPLDLVFRDERGGEVRLADFFHPGRPVLLQLGYYRCPMLCGLVVNSMIAGLNGLDWTPGKEYEVISVSIDPTETPLRRPRQHRPRRRRLHLRLGGASPAPAPAAACLDRLHGPATMGPT